MLDKKIAVITGSGSGVGRATALLFASHGAKLVCADIQAGWAEETAGMIAARGGAAIAQRCDVGLADHVDACVARAVDTFGRLDIMVNNAGIATPKVDGKGKSFLDHDTADIERLVSINQLGVIHGCQAAVRQFRRQGPGGVIVNTSSVAGLVGWGGVVYGATKGAVNQITRGLAIEVAKDGTRVNAICPAGMMTSFGKSDGLNTRTYSNADLERYGALHPLGRPISAEDAAQAALFLASDMSANITGVLLPVDGGYSAQ